MRQTASKQYKWKSVVLITAVLVGVAVALAAMVSGCGPNDVIILDCPDAASPDSGDAGQGGGDPDCK
jgi:hypothetical protein